MKAVLTVILVILIYGNRLIHSHITHAMCKPRLTIIQVDKQFPEKDYFPFFIQVHRCGGSCYLHPSDQACSPLTMETIRIPVFDRLKSDQVFVEIKNHTSCRCDCVKSLMDCRLDLEEWKPNECRCGCRYSSQPPKDLTCKAGFRWDRYNCRCKCDIPPQTCPPRKQWNREACNCTCSKRVINRCQRKRKGLDYDNCECVDVQALRRGPEVKSKSGLFISMLIVQGVVILALLCVLINYIVKSRRRQSMTYTDGAEHPYPSKKTPSMADSGNISCSNGSVSVKGLDRKSNSNGSVCFESQLSRESTL